MSICCRRRFGRPSASSSEEPLIVAQPQRARRCVRGAVYFACDGSSNDCLSDRRHEPTRRIGGNLVDPPTSDSIPSSADRIFNFLARRHESFFFFFFFFLVVVAAVFFLLLVVVVVVVVVFFFAHACRRCANCDPCLFSDLIVALVP